MDLSQFANDVAAGVLFGLLGLALLALGFAVIDLLTPGNLGRLIVAEHNLGASLVTGAALLAVGGIVATSIATSDDDLGTGLLETAAFGVLGVALQGAAYGLLEIATPGRLGEAWTHEGELPAALTTAAALLAVGGIVAAAIA